MRSLFILLLCAQFVLPAQAFGPSPLRADTLVPSRADFERRFAKISEAARAPAEALPPPAPRITPALDTFLEKLWSVRSGREIDNFLTEADSRYENYPTDLKFAVAQLTLLKAFRGFGWQALPLLTVVGDARQQQAAEPREFFYRLVRLPVRKDWTGGWSYVSAPFGGFQPAFGLVGLMQSAVDDRIYPEILRAIQRVSALSVANEPVAVDPRQPLDFLGVGARAIRWMDESDRALLLAQLHRLAYFYSLSLVYETNSYPALQARLKLPPDLLGLPLELSRAHPAERAMAIRSSSEAQSFQQRSDADIWLQRAYSHLYGVIGFSRMAWLQGVGKRDRIAPQIRRLFPALTEVDDIRIRNLWHLVENEGMAEFLWRNGSTERKLQVNLHAFITGLPQEARLLLPPWGRGAYSALFPEAKTDAEVVAQLRLFSVALGMPGLEHPLLLLGNQ